MRKAKGIVGCCGGGVLRHEVCSHVKTYIKNARKDYLKEVTDVIVRNSREIEHCDDEIVNNTGSLLLAIHELETLKGGKE